MNDHIRALDERTRSVLWPDRWMTLPEIAAELDDQCFWARPGLAGWSPEGRLHWLRTALATRDRAGRSLWLRMGAHYKHFALVRQNRGDIDDYLTWVAEARAARTRRAEELLAGETITAVKLHPLAEPDECRDAASQFTLKLIASVPDEEIVARLREIWSIYEQAGPLDAVVGLRVCRLFCALGVLFAEYRKGQDTTALRQAVDDAEAWLGPRLCLPVEEDAEGPLAKAG